MSTYFRTRQINKKKTAQKAVFFYFEGKIYVDNYNYFLVVFVEFVNNSSSNIVCNSSE